MGFLFSVCKGKQLYSESNRFSGYWSNKFRKYLCNYLFYREISINRESLPDSLPRPLRKEGSENPTQPPRRGRRQVCKYLQKLSKERTKISYLPRVRIGTPPLSGRLGGAPPLLSEGSGEAVEVGGGFLFSITQSQSQNHKKDFQCVKKGSYII